MNMKSLLRNSAKQLRSPVAVVLFNGKAYDSWANALTVFHRLRNKTAEGKTRKRVDAVVADYGSFVFKCATCPASWRRWTMELARRSGSAITLQTSLCARLCGSAMARSISLSSLPFTQAALLLTPLLCC